MHELTIYLGAIGIGCLSHGVFLLGSPPFVRPGTLRPQQFHPLDPLTSIHLWTTSLTVLGLVGLGFFALGTPLPIAVSGGVGIGAGYSVAALMQWLARRDTPTDAGRIEDAPAQ